MASSVSKREKARFNQRQSRARKQEYIQDMEQRLRDNDKIYREVQLQRDLYRQTHRENLRFRAWITELGYTESDIDVIVNDSENSGPAPDQTSLRRIRPKIQLEEGLINMSPKAISTPSPAHVPPETLFCRDGLIGMPQSLFPTVEITNN